jgi:hypothetical protein
MRTMAPRGSTARRRAPLSARARRRCVARGVAFAIRDARAEDGNAARSKDMGRDPQHRIPAPAINTCHFATRWRSGCCIESRPCGSAVNISPCDGSSGSISRERASARRPFVGRFATEMRLDRQDSLASHRRRTVHTTAEPVFRSAREQSSRWPRQGRRPTNAGLTAVKLPVRRGARSGASSRSNVSGEPKDDLRWGYAAVRTSVDRDRSRARDPSHR